MNDPAFWYAKARMELRLARTALRILKKLEAALTSSQTEDRENGRSKYWLRANLAALESMTIWLCQAVESRADMLETLMNGHDAEGRPRDRLSERQREIVKAVHSRLIPEYENLVSSGKVPRGREVPDPPALSYRPLKPPPRRSEP